MNLSNLLNITLQAKVIIALGILQFLTYVYTSPRDFLFIFLILVTFLITTSINAYSVNCLVVGNCELYSWIVVGVSLFYITLLLISSISMTRKNRNLRRLSD